MAERIIRCKVISIHPAHDIFGNEYVCIEFGVESQPPPAFAVMPRDVPQEISAIMPIISQIPKMFGQARAYAKRFVLFLTQDEWGWLEKRPQYGDEVELVLRSDGSFSIRLV